MKMQHLQSYQCNLVMPLQSRLLAHTHRRTETRAARLSYIWIVIGEEGVTGKTLKFADDTKLFTKTKENGDNKKLQDDIDKLVTWSEKWQMLFNFGKCKCLHIGPGNASMNYEMGGTILSKTVKEKDLGVTMNANMKVSEQCRIAPSKGNQVLGMIRRNITYKDKSLIVPLYKAIVRPHLEYCIQAWSPYLRKDIDMLEKYRGEQLNSFQD